MVGKTAISKNKKGHHANRLEKIGWKILASPPKKRKVVFSTISLLFIFVGTLLKKSDFVVLMFSNVFFLRKLVFFEGSLLLASLNIAVKQQHCVVYTTDDKIACCFLHACSTILALGF